MSKSRNLVPQSVEERAVMASCWPRVPLGEILIERQERPFDGEILDGSCRIVSKISFDGGTLHFRTDPETKTGMILIRPGDLVVSGINAYKGAVALYTGDESACATIHYGSYQVQASRADKRYLWWLLRSRRFQELLAEHVPGGIKTELKAKRLLPIPIPLPSLAEQRRLVERIDALAVKIEEAKKLRKTINQEQQALSTLAISGVLEELDFVGMLGDVLLAPPRNGWSARCDGLDTGTAILSLGAVTGFWYRSDQCKRTSEVTDPHAHYWLKPGDLLISRSNTPDLVGHAAIYDGTPFPCIYPDLLMLLRIDKERCDQRFVHYVLQSRRARDFIRAYAKGTSPTMKKISQGTVMRIPFPADCPRQRQVEIADRLDTIRMRLQDAAAKQSLAAQALHALLPSILDRAFKGEL